MFPDFAENIQGLKSPPATTHKHTETHAHSSFDPKQQTVKPPGVVQLLLPRPSPLSCPCLHI